VGISDRDLALAREHPRGTERRALLPFREALNDAAAYARLSVGERDVIVRWAETRRRLLAAYGLDNDAANLADPLLPYASLRDAVLRGESGGSDEALAAQADDADDLRAVVARMRANRAR
jgi:hypothetical protein